jgi:hypothetical protein
MKSGGMGQMFSTRKFHAQTRYGAGDKTVQKNFFKIFSRKNDFLANLVLEKVRNHRFRKNPSDF